MGGDRKELRARAVKAAQYKRSADVALVLEQALLQQRHGSYDAGALASMKFVQLHVARDEVRDKLGVGRRSGTTAPDAVRDIVDLFTVLVGDNRALGRTRIGTEHDAIFVDQSDDRRTRARRTRDRVAIRR